MLEVQSLIETKSVRDIFVSDLGRIEILGKNARFVLYVKHYSDEGAAPINLIVAKVIMPIDVIPGAIARTLFAIGQSAVPAALTFSKRLN